MKVFSLFPLFSLFFSRIFPSFFPPFFILFFLRSFFPFRAGARSGDDQVRSREQRAAINAPLNVSRDVQHYALYTVDRSEPTISTDRLFIELRARERPRRPTSRPTDRRPTTGLAIAILQTRRLFLITPTTQPRDPACAPLTPALLPYLH